MIQTYAFKIMLIVSKIVLSSVFTLPRKLIHILDPLKVSGGMLVRAKKIVAQR